MALLVSVVTVLTTPTVARAAPLVQGYDFAGQRCLDPAFVNDPAMNKLGNQYYYTLGGEAPCGDPNVPGYEYKRIPESGCRTVTVTRQNTDYNAFPKNVQDALEALKFEPSKPMDITTLQATFCWDGTKIVGDVTNNAKHSIDAGFALVGGRELDAGPVDQQPDAKQEPQWVLSEYTGEFQWVTPLDTPIEPFPWDSKVSIRVHHTGNFECSPAGSTSAYTGTCTSGGIRPL